MPNCIQHPEQECFGMAEAQILRQQMKSIERQIKQDKKERQREAKRNKKDHKEFYHRMEFSEKAQALTQSQLAQILQTAVEIKAGQDQQSVDILSIKTAQQSNSASIEKLEKQQEAQGKDIDAINEKPAKNWENLKSIVFAVVVTAIATLVLTRIGLTT